MNSKSKIWENNIKKKSDLGVRMGFLKKTYL